MVYSVLAYSGWRSDMFDVAFSHVGDCVSGRHVDSQLRKGEDAFQF